MARRRRRQCGAAEESRDVAGASQSLPSRSPDSRQPGQAPQQRAGQRSQVTARTHVLATLATVVLTVWSYWPSLKGEFVYDDRVQIADNPFVQRDDLLWTGLTSDVWAFQGLQPDRPRNYWRPAFVAAAALQFRLFGLSPQGWHVVNLTLHAAVAMLAYLVLLQLGFAWELAAGVSWLFATHPVHTQSVAWISGLPDPLASAFLLGAYACYLKSRREGRWPSRTGALLLFALALFSKESSVALVAVILVTEWVLSRGAGRTARIRASLLAAVPFGILVGLFAVTRFLVLHGWRSLSPEAPSITTVLATLPAVLLFYGRQVVLPVHLGPVQPIRYVDPSSTDPRAVLLQCAGVLLIGAVLWRLQRRQPLAAIGLAWLVFPLLPVLDTRIFQPELIVQDRYLYLPVLGALLVLASGLHAATLTRRSPAGRRLLVAVTLAAGLGGGLVVRREAAHWADGLALWGHAAEVDPTSAIAWSQLGDEYQARGRLADGQRAFERALGINPDLTAAQVGLGIVAAQERRWSDVERHLRPVLARLPDHETALEQLGHAYQLQAQFEKAIAVFEEGRRRVPRKRDLYSVNVAVLTAQAGRLAEATRQLEGLVAHVDDRADAEVLKAWWYLGELYRAQGDPERARSAYTRYLAISSRSGDPHVQKLRRLAGQSLEGLAGK